jgi:hypothetical protein
VRHKSEIKRALRTVGLRRPSPPWVVDQADPSRPEPLDAFGLIAIVPTWLESDVIEATVRNAFTQGCDRVLVLDNDSPDDTVAVATAAGAELVRTYSTPQLDEPLKIRLLNEIVREISPTDGRGHVWWLWLDADEFVHGPGGATVRELLAGLDRRYRVVGTRYLNHFPEAAPASLPGFHPVDLQPLAQEQAGNTCRLRHRKHHLQRWDREGPPITSGLGFHAARSAATLVEPTTATITHHFPYRLEAVTRARFEVLCGRDPAGRSRVDLYDHQVRRNAGTISDMSKRMLTLDHVYAGEWDRVENLRRDGRVVGVRPQPWTALVPPADTEIARWYPTASLDAAVAEWRSSVNAVASGS